jgi:hypothetical protein
LKNTPNQGQQLSKKTLLIQILANVFLLLGIMVNDLYLILQIIFTNSKVLDSSWQFPAYLGLFFEFSANVGLMYSLC